jgi:hypothetical protein
MAEVYKVLGQAAPAATTLTTLYTVPGSTQAIVSTLVACNRGVAMTYRIAVRPDGAAIANQHYLVYNGNLGANESEVMTMGITLGDTDVVSVYASHANASFSAFGSEIT